MKGGVDRSDQLRNYYEKGKTYLQFRINLAKQPIGEYMGKKLQGHPSSSSYCPTLPFES